MHTDNLAAAGGHTPVADGAEQGDGPRARGHMRAAVRMLLCVPCVIYILCILLYITGVLHVLFIAVISLLIVYVGTSSTYLCLWASGTLLSGMYRAAY